MTIFIVLILLLAGCSNVQHNTDLEISILSLVENNSNNDISLNQMTSFDWEKAFLFTPYSTQKEIEKQLGVNFNDPSNINMRDDIYLLVFMNDDKVVQYVEVERHGADFTIEGNEYLTPAEDRIIIDRH
ncbi:hypothetical protein [Paucisalibacillus globulus]|uniref:hypothetical protein n=1 Tax=Paucisalibacillus globulus TaxID=351095 RepID=UPI000421DB60|nr:hypothetical protein [Paucisalibacillus globulus]